MILFGPVPRGGFTLGTSFSPDLFEGIGNASKNPQNGGGVGLMNATFIFSMGYVQGVMSFVFDSPSLLFQTQPLGVTQLPLCS
jgi:hypothetical protein